MDYEIRDQPKPTVSSSLYGTLPRRGRRSRKSAKKTPEEMAITLAQYAVYQAEKVRTKDHHGKSDFRHWLDSLYLTDINAASLNGWPKVIIDKKPPIESGGKNEVIKHSHQTEFVWLKSELCLMDAPNR